MRNLSIGKLSVIIKIMLVCFSCASFGQAFSILNLKNENKIVVVKNVNEEKVKPIPDSIPKIPINTVSKLEVNDSIVLDFSSWGCFHTEFYKICITRKANYFLAQLIEVELDSKEEELVTYDKKVLKEVIMTSSNLESFLKFENELSELKATKRCTTTENYGLKSKFFNINKTDGSCEWNGFNVLKTSLFGKEN